MLTPQIAPGLIPVSRPRTSLLTSTIRPGSKDKFKCGCQHSRGMHSIPTSHADAGPTGWLAPSPPKHKLEDHSTVPRSVLVENPVSTKPERPHKLHLSISQPWRRALPTPHVGPSPPSPQTTSKTATPPIISQHMGSLQASATVTSDPLQASSVPHPSVGSSPVGVSTQGSNSTINTVIYVGNDSPVATTSTGSQPLVVGASASTSTTSSSASTAAGPSGQASSPLASMQVTLQALLRSLPQLPQAASASNTGTPLFHHTCSPDKLWALTLLSATYVHQAATGFSIPVMMPTITMSLDLSDLQGALLTSGYTCMYALALVPAGIMADKTRSRTGLLGAGVTVWSALALAASNAQGFTQLMMARVGLAVAQSTQNVVCFSVIPDLFPKNKSTALAVYNCAIYIGRGLMYLAFNAARGLVGGGTGSPGIQATVDEVIRDPSGNLLVPLDKLDLRLVQLVYTSGDMAAIRATTPLYFLPETLEAEVAASLADHDIWRNVLENLTIPGLLLGAALFCTVQEPDPLRSQRPFILPRPLQFLSGPLQAISQPLTAITQPLQALTRRSSTTTTSASTNNGSAAIALLPAAAATTATTTVATAAATAAATATAVVASSELDSGAVIWRLLTLGPFLTTTLAAALNDVASYAMIAWQSTFYERVYDLTPDQYAPVLATLLPLCGIVGGVGGGLLADRLSLKGHRAWVTVATTMCAAPLIAASLSAPTPEESFLYLGLGFALSEAWRAPSAIMARSVVPPEQAATAMSLYLCVRNVIGGMGPIIVAQMAHTWGLQTALQILPGMYVASGMLFWRAEHLLGKHEASKA